MLCEHRQRGQKRQRIERRHGGASFQCVHWHIEHRKMIGHEERIEAAAFERLCEGNDVLEVEVRVRGAARVAPPRRVYAHWPHKGAES